MSTTELFDQSHVMTQRQKSRAYYLANRDALLAKAAEKRKKARKAELDRASYLRRKERKLKEQEVLSNKFSILGYLRNLFTGGAR